VPFTKLPDNIYGGSISDFRLLYRKHSWMEILLQSSWDEGAEKAAIFAASYTPISEGCRHLKMTCSICKTGQVAKKTVRTTPDLDDTSGSTSESSDQEEVENR